MSHSLSQQGKFKQLMTHRLPQEEDSNGQSPNSGRKVILNQDVLMPLMRNFTLLVFTLW